LCAAIGQALPGQLVLDGEIVYLGKDGCPRFYDLMRRRTPQYFYAFDLLWKDGQDLQELPLIQRKRLLKTIVKAPALFVDHLVGRGVDLFQAVCQRDLEGIVAKAAQGLYQLEKTTWVRSRTQIIRKLRTAETFSMFAESRRCPKLYTLRGQRKDSDRGRIEALNAGLE
jgi:ATP-dependent DNA ligase